EGAFLFYHEKQLSAGKFGAKLGISRSIAYNWPKKDENGPSDKIQPRKAPEAGNGRLKC
ncbi:hypothetical protein BCV72DRAFT_213736, partial [Rhizopus microsporus var. microsporus]